MSDVLAGPILRRVDFNQVNIWLASNGPLDLKGELYVSDDLVTNIGVSNPRSVKLGDGLYVHLVRIFPVGDAKYPKDKLLCYDLKFTKADGSEESLTRDNHDVIFAGGRGVHLPSFFIPSSFKNVLHGSCRKPHAKQSVKGWNKVDQLSCGADLIEKHLLDLNERPVALFLTGDQIYADDVAMPLLAMSMKKSKELMGWDERIPVDANGSEVIPAKIKLGGRARDLKLNNHGFTSGESDNHLLTFGEFASMYLAAFGGEVSLPTSREEFANMHSTSNGASAYRWDRERALKFFSTRTDIRRLLANIPVYMIFDDHEVTDDWNLNINWEEKMYGNAFGRRVISNGLAAYWAFQGWGNDPDKFDDHFIEIISNHLNSKEVRGAGANEFDEKMLDQSSVDRWAYLLPTDPFTVVLDTRTQREAGSGGNSGACCLMNQNARQWLQSVLEQEQQRRGENYPLLLVSATPVFGFARMERLQEIASRLGLSVAAIDKESWKEGFHQLQYTITESSCVIDAVTILSGDVHYSFSVVDNFCNAAGSKTPVAQLTSSPLSNSPAGGFVGKNLLKVNKGEFPEMVRPIEGHKCAVTSLNQLGLVAFDQSGFAAKQVLVSKKSLTSAAENSLTYQFDRDGG